MDCKLIALDIDATLTNDEKVITPKTKEALIKAQEQGVKVVVASGRMPFGVKPFAEELKSLNYDGYYMGFNGGAVMNSEDEVISSTYLDKKYLELVYQELKDTNITTIVHKDDILFSDRKVNEFTEVEPTIIGTPMIRVDDLCGFVNWDIYKILLAGEREELETVEKVLLEKYSDELDIYFSAPWFLEVMPKGVDKGTGLKEICDRCNIDMSQVIACGDSFNDQSMIETAGLGVVMANGREELKEIADYVTVNDCNNDGIAEVVNRFILNKN